LGICKSFSQRTRILNSTRVVAGWARNSEFNYLILARKTWSAKILMSKGIQPRNAAKVRNVYLSELWEITRFNSK